MSCCVCNGTIEGAIMTLPCCSAQVHTMCGLREASMAYSNLSCWACNRLLLGVYPSQQTIPQEFFNEALPIKKKVAAYKKTKWPLTAVIKTEYTNFKTVVAPHIQAIKDYRQVAMTTIKLSDEYKTSIKASRSIVTTLNSLQKKYSLSRRSVWNYFNLRWYRRTPMTELRRKFGIRI